MPNTASAITVKQAGIFKRELDSRNQEPILQHLRQFEDLDKRYDELYMMLCYNVFDNSPAELAQIIKQTQLGFIIYDINFSQELQEKGPKFY